MPAAGGSNTQVQFNSAGDLAGSNDLVWLSTYLQTAQIRLPVSTSQGGYELFRFHNNEADIPDFSFVLTQHDGDNGATQQDNVFSFGYNVNGSGAKQISGKHQFTHVIESDYTTSQAIRQLEMYYNYISEDGTVSYRPFGITPNLSNNTCVVATRSHIVVFGSVDTGNDWLRIDSANGSDGGTLSILGEDSFFNFASDTVDCIRRNGSTMISARSGVCELAGGFETAELFKGSNAFGGDLSMNFGGSNTRGIRFQGSKRWFQAQIAASKWEALMTMGSVDSSNLNGTHNNWTPANAAISRVLRMQALSNSTITGFLPELGAYDGEEHVLINTSSFVVTLAHQHTDSTAANRFLCASGRNEVLLPKQAADIIYDGTSLRWRVFKRAQGGPEVIKA